MKIAFIVGQFPALSETFILDQVCGLIDCGHQVHIYAGNSGKSSKVHPNVYKYNLLSSTYYGLQMPKNRLVQVFMGLWLLITKLFMQPQTLMSLSGLYKYGKQIGLLRQLYFSMPFLDKQLSYDIIHCHFGVNGTKAVFLKSVGVFNGKLVTTFHGKDVTKTLSVKGNDIYNALFETVDLCLPVSERWRQLLIEAGCDKRKVQVHRMGIDCNTFTFKPRLLEVKEKVHFVTVARLTEKKGIEYGIGAVAKLIKNHQMVKYSIVGDGLLKEDLQNIINKLNVSDHIKLLGWKHQEEVIEILDSAHILLAPSITSKDGDQEGIPVSIMEAMALGLPVVSTFHSGIPELVQDGISGFLVPERDVDALTNKLEYLINNSEAWPKMGQAGRACVEDQYNINKLSDRLVEIYQGLLSL